MILEFLSSLSIFHYSNRIPKTVTANINTLFLAAQEMGWFKSRIPVSGFWWSSPDARLTEVPASLSCPIENLFPWATEKWLRAQGGSPAWLCPPGKSKSHLWFAMDPSWRCNSCSQTALNKQTPTGLLRVCFMNIQLKSAKADTAWNLENP